MKKKLLISLSVVLVVSILGLFLWQTQQGPNQATESISGTIENDDEQTQATASDPRTVTRSSAELLEAITKQVPSLTNTTGQPTFAIASTQKVDGVWYVATLKSTVSNTIGPTKIILKDNGEFDGGLIVAAGPGTFFSDTTPVPENVRNIL